MMLRQAMIRIAVALTGAALLLASPRVAAAPSLLYSQDGKHFAPLNALVTAMSATDYYGYRRASAHPGFGLAANTETVSMVWDSTHGALSLLFVSGDHDAGRGKVTATGLPTAAVLNLRDDPTEFSFAPTTGTLTSEFHYGGSTDGFVLGSLEHKKFVAKLNFDVSVKNLRITSGDPAAGGSFLPLNLDAPLFIESDGDGVGGARHTRHRSPVSSGVGAAVPEPTSLALLSIGAIALFKRPRRR